MHKLDPGSNPGPQRYKASALTTAPPAALTNEQFVPEAIKQPVMQPQRTVEPVMQPQRTVEPVMQPQQAVQSVMHPKPPDDGKTRTKRSRDKPAIKGKQRKYLQLDILIDISIISNSIF